MGSPALVPLPSRPETLALAFQELLTVIARIRADRQPIAGVDSFRSQVKEALSIAAAEARRTGYTAEDTYLATLAVVAFLDEAVLYSANPAFRDWSRQTLQLELFGSQIAGETFFQHLKDILGQDDSPRVADLLEIYQLCLTLGYRGRYGSGRDSELKAISERIDSKMRRIRPAWNTVSPFWAPPREAPSPAFDLWVRRLLYAVGALAVLSLLLLLIYRVSLDSMTTEIRAQAPLSSTPGA